MSQNKQKHPFYNQTETPSLEQSDKDQDSPNLNHQTSDHDPPEVSPSNSASQSSGILHKHTFMGASSVRR